MPFSAFRNQKMMAFKVLLTDDAVNDLLQLNTYISKNDSPEKADDVLDKIEASLNKLSHMPDRGTYPKELLSLGIREYQEIFFKPYRIIYRVQEKKVYVYLIADGRRDMQSLLSRRLLEA